MRKKTRNYNKYVKLKHELIGVFILFFLLPAIVISIIYYAVASYSILGIAKKNILDVTVKNTQIVDEQLRNLQNSAININVDKGLYELIRSVDEVVESELLAKDREVQKILKRYFSNKYILTANLMTHRYTFGDNSQLVISNKAFFNSDIYGEVQGTYGEAKWIPTFNAEEVYNLDFPVVNNTVFSLVQVLNSRLLNLGDTHDSKNLGSDKEVVIYLNIDEGLIKDIFEKSNSIEESFYCISSKEGEIVAHTNDEMHGVQEVLPWLEEAQIYQNGSVILEYQKERVVVCFAVSEITGWVSAVVTPISSLLDSVSKLQMLTGVIWIILVFIVICLATIFVRNITKPIELLVSGMKEIGKGNFEFRLRESGVYELRYLTRKYNELGNKIKILIEENYKSKIREKEAEIMALNLQMNPHFLYNTLNIINMMALERGDRAISKMIITLSDMLQYTFRNKKETVLFEEEYLWLQNYLYIMRIRFEDKFEVEYEVEEELFQYKIPKLLLQPLVENAIVHGFSGMRTGGVLSIHANKKRNSLYLEIEDNGKGINQNQQNEIMKGNSNRIGISNVIRRLQLLYGDQAKIEIISILGKGTRIRLYIPLVKDEK